MEAERGQATIEWVGLVLLAAVVLAGAAAVAGPNVDGRSFGGFLTHRILCAVRGGCDDGEAQLVATYGRGDAELLRRHAPNIAYEPGERQLPVAWTECRKVACANAPNDRDLDAHRTEAGRRATVYTRVVRREGRTYLQYWLYFPDSNSMPFKGGDKIWKHAPTPVIQVPKGLQTLWSGSPSSPGFHFDDWESYQVRIDRGGRVSVRASAHKGYDYCKQRLRSCSHAWGPATGWTRVSHGSHAGHIPQHRDGRPRFPGRDMRERSSTSAGLRLIPLESLDKRGYRPLKTRRDMPWRKADRITPPWRKPVYRDPEAGGT